MRQCWAHPRSGAEWQWLLKFYAFCLGLGVSDVLGTCGLMVAPLVFVVGRSIRPATKLKLLQPGCSLFLGCLEFDGEGGGEV